VKNLAKAVHLYYANSGSGENGQYCEYNRKWEGKPIDQEDVCRQVDAQKSTCNDYFHMFNEFFLIIATPMCRCSLVVLVDIR
jgi:hypothetical protein